MERHTTTLSYGMSIFAAMLGFLNANAAAIGVLIALATFFINWYYQHKKFNLEKK